MALLVHLAPEKSLRSIRRAGIRPVKMPWAVKHRGVYCMPVLPDYFVSHQWLRELRRRGTQRFFAVHFRVPDAQPVLVGHYNRDKLETTVAQAIAVILRQPDARGYELILPRAVKAAEVHAIRSVPQVVGWRFSPEVKGRKPCGCDFCQRGQRDSRRLRDPEVEREPLPRIMAKLQAAPGPKEAYRIFLDKLHGRRFAGADRLRFLLAFDDPELLTLLAEQLRYVRGREAPKLLRELASAPRPGWSKFDLEELREVAAESLERLPRRFSSPRT